MGSRLYSTPPLQPARSGTAYAQTLSRGIQILEFLSNEQGGQALTVISEATGVGRPVTYRLLRTLAAHGLIVQHADHTYELGSGLVTLARGVATDVRTQAFPVLLDVAERLGATCFLGAAEGADFVCVVSAEPRSARLRVSYREGLRHPIRLGAGGAAILSTRPPRKSDRAAVKHARENGYARSEGEVETDFVGFAVPVVRPGEVCSSSVVALFPSSRVRDSNSVVPLLRAAAERISRMTDLH